MADDDNNDDDQTAYDGKLKAVGAARLVTGFVPGTQALDPLFAAGEGNLEARRDMELMRKEGLDPDRDQHSNRGLRVKMEQLENRWSGRLGEAAISATGAIAGAAIGTAIFPGLGTIAGFMVGAAGSFVGGVAADKVYNIFSPRMVQDPMALDIQMAKSQRKGEAVTPEMVFAVLAPTIPDAPLVEAIETRLGNIAGTRSFNEALETDKGRAALRDLLQTGNYDEAIRGLTCMQPDATGRNACEQYADMINAGQMQAIDLPFEDGRRPTQSPQLASGAALPNVPYKTQPQTTARS